MRVWAEQVCPLLSMQAETLPLTAAAKSASSKITLADLPPNSKATRLMLCAANSPTRLPARVDPVKLTISTSGWPGQNFAHFWAGAVDQVEDARWQACCHG
jgi:hypothetical protein